MFLPRHAGQTGVRAKRCCSCPECCSCHDMLSLVLVPRHLPRHADQRRARAKICAPAWCACQDRLASLAFVLRHAARVQNVFVPRHAEPGPRAKTILPSLDLMPRHSGLVFADRPGVRTWTCGQTGVGAKTCDQPGVGAKTVVVARHATSLVPAFVPRHAWCLCQDMLPAWCSYEDKLASPVLRAWTCGAAGVSLVFVQQKTGGQRRAASLVFVFEPRHAGQPGARANELGVRAKRCSCQDMLASWCWRQDMLPSRAFVPRRSWPCWQPARAKTCWPTLSSCQDMLARLQAGARAKPRHDWPAACAKTCWPA